MSRRDSPTNATLLLHRRGRVAHIFDVSESQVLKFEAQGLLKAIRMPGLRAVWYAASEVERLAQRLIDGAKTERAASPAASERATA
jgi:hypothetical protein